MIKHSSELLMIVVCYKLTTSKEHCYYLSTYGHSQMFYGFYGCTFILL